MQQSRHSFFTPALLQWHRHVNTRTLPWKGIRDPYKIWLSEIILQQTRAEQGRPYYERFTAAYPTVYDLAQAPEEEVFRLWQGLGYYNRCRNLLATARTVSEVHGGKFPETYEGLLSLKGIGPYTAAAIASFAFDQAHAVVDGNVFRVLARYLGLYTPPATPEGKALFTKKANTLLDPAHPAQWNQAIMDLGATVCTPANPDCKNCPLQSACFAFQNNAVTELPVRIAKAPLRQRYLHYILFRKEDQIWLERRIEGIWHGLYQPFCIEAEAPLDRKALAATLEAQGIPVSDLQYEGYLKRKLTHQALDLYFFESGSVPEKLPSEGSWISLAALKNTPLPKPLELFFAKKAYF